MLFLLCKVVRISAKGVLLLIFIELSYVIFWNFFSTYYKKESWGNRVRLTTEKRNLPSNREAKCELQKNVVFLKTHKTGSSTMTNIFNRFAEYHNLNMAIPIDGFENFLWPLPFHTDFVDTNSRPVNILSNHARFYNYSFRQLMPSKTKYITILRNPLTQFPSLFKYMDLGDSLKLLNPNHPTISLQHFLDNSHRILEELNKNNRQAFIGSPSLYLLRNPQLFDLGLEFSLSNDTYEYNAQKQISTVDMIFDLVLLMEHFDESLVLLKRRLCWDLDDVTYFKHNQQIRTNGEKITSIVEEKLRNWTNSDTALYKYFYKRFWIDIEREGPNFWEEVRRLRRLNKNLAKICLNNDTVYGKAYKGSTATIYKHSLKLEIPSHMRSRCMKMTRSEVEYLDHFRHMYKKS